MCLALFNAYFLGFPTLATLLGHPAAHQATPAQVVQIANMAHRRVAVDPAAIPLGRGASLHGVTLPVTFPATTSHFAARPGWVYLPPAWFGPARSRLPVIVLISGALRRAPRNGSSAGTSTAMRTRSRAGTTASHRSWR